MAISDNYVPVKELGNGSTTEFGGDWAVLSASFIRVYLESVATGDQVLQVEGVDYTLEFNDSGFTVTFLVAPTSDNYIVISRDVAKTQTTPYKTSKGFQGYVTEGDFDKVIVITQDIQDQVDRSPKTQVGASPLVFPPYSADSNIGWSSTVDGEVVNGTKTMTEIDAAVDLVNAITAGSGVLVSGADTTIGFLSTKIIAGDSVSLTINNPSSVETLTVDITEATETDAGTVEAANASEMTAGTAGKFPDCEKVSDYVVASIASRIILETPVATTSGTSHPFAGIPAGTKKITVGIMGVSTNGTSPIILQIGDSGGLETTGYLGSATNVGTSSSNLSTGFTVAPAVGAGSIIYGSLFLTLMDSSTNTWVISGGIGHSDVAQNQIVMGEKSLTDVLTQLTLTTANGTDAFDAGKINIQYE